MEREMEEKGWRKFRMRVENLNKQMVRARFKNDLISRGKVKEERDYDYASLGKILANICVTSLIPVIAPISTESRKFFLANSEFTPWQRDLYFEREDPFSTRKISSSKME